MLTIREPIKLNNVKLTCGSLMNFGNRIIANYNQISADITSKDLMHVVTEPPEVFFAEGDVNSIFISQQNQINTQEHKVEIVNNLVNRILLSPSGQLTYQDRVYISNVLRKLGIKNENHFLKEVYNNLNETKNITSSVKSIENQVSLLQTKNISNTQNENTRISDTFYEQTSNTNRNDTSFTQVNYSHRVSNEENIFEDNEENQYNIISSKNINNQTLQEMVTNSVLAEINNQQTDISSVTLTELLNSRTDITNNFESVANKVEEALSLVKVNNVGGISSQSQTSIREYISNALLVLQEEHINNFLNRVEKTITDNLQSTNLYELIQNDLKAVSVSAASMTLQRIKNVNRNIVENAMQKLSNVNNTNTFNRVDAKSILEGNSLELVHNTVSNIEENELEQSENVTHVNNISRVDASLIENKNTQLQLYEQVFKRLGTKNDIQLIQKFTQDVNGSTSFTSNELSLSNQNTVKNEITISEARTRGIVPADVYVLEQNEFELQQDINNISQEQFDSQLTSAVLYSLIDSVYQTTINKNQNDGANWYQVQNALYNATEDTLNRFEENITNPSISTVHYNTNNEEFIENLNQINLSNEDRRKTFEQYIQSENQIRSEKKPIHQGDMAKETLEALSNPEEFLKKIQVEKQQAMEAARIEQLEADERVPEAIKNRLQLLQAVMTANPETGEISEEGLGAMQRVFKELQDEKSFEIPVEVIHQEPEVVKKQEFEQQIEETVKHSVKKTIPVVVEREVSENKEINFIHKTIDTLDSDEIIERLEEQKQLINATRTVNQESHETVNEVTSVETTRNIVQNEVKNLDFTKEIRTTVQGELRGIEDHIFRELENRLDNEKRRRGF